MRLSLNVLLVPCFVVENLGAILYFYFRGKLLTSSALFSARRVALKFPLLRYEYQNETEYVNEIERLRTPVTKMWPRGVSALLGRCVYEHTSGIKFIRPMVPLSSAGGRGIHHVYSVAICGFARTVHLSA